MMGWKDSIPLPFTSLLSSAAGAHLVWACSSLPGSTTARGGWGCLWGRRRRRGGGSELVGGLCDVHLLRKVLKTTFMSALVFGLFFRLNRPVLAAALPDCFPESSVLLSLSTGAAFNTSLSLKSIRLLSSFQNITPSTPFLSAIAKAFFSHTFVTPPH